MVILFLYIFFLTKIDEFSKINVRRKNTFDFYLKYIFLRILNIPLKIDSFFREFINQVKKRINHNNFENDEITSEHIQNNFAVKDVPK